MSGKAIDPRQLGHLHVDYDCLVEISWPNEPGEPPKMNPVIGVLTRVEHSRSGAKVTIEVDGRERSVHLVQEAAEIRILRWDLPT